MKKVILSTLILVLAMSLFLGVATVSAEGEQVKEGTLYQIKSEVVFGDPNRASVKGLKLPADYWIEYVRPEGNDHIVKYNDVELIIDGTSFNLLSKFDDTKYEKIEQPMFSLSTSLHVKHTLIQNLYTTKDCTNAIPNSFTDENVALTFLNKEVSANGDVVYLVYRADNNMIGYIFATNTSNDAITIPSAPTLIAKPEPEPTPEPEAGGDNVVPDTGSDILPEDGFVPDTDNNAKPPKNNIVKIVLIVAICVLAAILVFLIFKPTRTNKGRYEVDDYDDYDRDDSYNDRY